MAPGCEIEAAHFFWRASLSIENTLNEWVRTGPGRPSRGGNYRGRVRLGSSIIKIASSKTPQAVFDPFSNPIFWGEAVLTMELPRRHATPP